MSKNFCGRGALLATAFATCASHAWAQDPQASTTLPSEGIQSQGARPSKAPPPGFENIDDSVVTVFDLYFAGRRIGAASGRLENGRFYFDDPAAIAKLLPDADTLATTDFLSGAVTSNETLRCLPGETIDCGVLLNGVSGIIVNPDNFRVDIFLGRELLIKRDRQRLGEPVSGMSLIQGFNGTISASNSSDQSARFGVSLDTIASLGRNSVVSRIFGDNERGLQVDEAFVQSYRNDRRFSGGLFTTPGAMALSTLRVVGVQVSSFYGDYVQPEQLSASAIDVLLPRPARVEIYRDGVLVSSSQYAGGLQNLDATRLPAGSYPIRIIARDASGVVLDEIRSFTRATDLPPIGKWVYSGSLGSRLTDNFVSLLDADVHAPFLPENTGELVFAANVSRRVGEAVALGVGVTIVDKNFYPEVSSQAYFGQFRGFASAAVGPDGQYALVAGGGATFGRISTTLNLRASEALPLPTDPELRFRQYRPFVSDERSVNLNLQAPVAGGALGLRASYGEFEGLPNRYAVAANFSKPLEIKRVGRGILSFEALRSDSETRVGFRFTMVRGRSDRGSISAAGGLEYIKSQDLGGRDGFYPTAQLGYSRAMQLGETELGVSGTAGFTSGDAGVQTSAQARSRLGGADLAVGVIRTQGAQNTDAFVTGNIQTGIVYGGGHFFAGGGVGDAAIIATIKDESSARTSDDGRFRVLIDDMPYDTLKAGQSAVVPLAAFTQPRVALGPDAAPPFEIDLGARTAPLYPGNVVVMTWEATRVVTVYGRILDQNGKPVVGAFVNAGSDVAVTGEGGYFSVTGPIGGAISVRSSESTEACPAVAVLPAPSGDKRRAVVNMGPLTCALGTKAAAN